VNSACSSNGGRRKQRHPYLTPGVPSLVRVPIRGTGDASILLGKIWLSTDGEFDVNTCSLEDANGGEGGIKSLVRRELGSEGLAKKKRQKGI